MELLEFLRQFRAGGYAIFDLVVSFVGVYLLAPRITRLALKINIVVPKKNWLFLVLPIGILLHLIFGTITPMTNDFIDLHGHYLLKIVVVTLFFIGMTGIKKKHLSL